jgi:hypothetical protein
MRTGKMRGQAFVVFEEQAAATSAMRALVGEEFYGRPLVRLHVIACNGRVSRRLTDDSPSLRSCPAHNLRQDAVQRNPPTA